jgi:hypothetical protein
MSLTELSAAQFIRFSQDRLLIRAIRRDARFKFGSGIRFPTHSTDIQIYALIEHGEQETFFRIDYYCVDPATNHDQVLGPLSYSVVNIGREYKSLEHVTPLWMKPFDVVACDQDKEGRIFEVSPQSHFLLPHYARLQVQLAHEIRNGSNPEIFMRIFSRFTAFLRDQIRTWDEFLGR